MSMAFDPKHLLQTVAAKLLQKRRELNWSQQDLADHSQVSRRMIGMIESGDSNVSLATLGHLAAALGIVTEALFVTTNPPSGVRSAPPCA